MLLGKIGLKALSMTISIYTFMLININENKSTLAIWKNFFPGQKYFQTYYNFSYFQAGVCMLILFFLT